MAKFILLIFLLFIQGCTDAVNTADSDILFVGTLVDVNSRPNQVMEDTSKNGIEVGLTVYVDNADNIVYQLLDSADGRFSIDELTGVVFLTDHLLLNANIFPIHLITVQATFVNGQSQSKNFHIAVIPTNTSSFELSELSYQINTVDDADMMESESTGLYQYYENDIPIINKYNMLLDWNNGSQQTLQGWTWYDDIAYGNPGWLLDEEGPVGGGEKYNWGRGVRSFNKGDYGKKNTALIDTHDYAPSTSGGGSLQVTETEGSTDHRSTWWLWYDGKPLSDRGITNNKTDRMSFYLKVEGMNRLKDDGGKESISTNFHIGTYLCWEAKRPAYGTGDGCPYEGPGNQHYYHYLGINPGAWIHVLLDQHPQHKRGSKKTLKNNPAWDEKKNNYFEQLSRFYFEIRAKQKQKTNYRIDELLFYSTEDSIEPMQNEESISSLWVGYWSEKKVWEIGFHDKSHHTYNDDNNSTFEIRWSTFPITNENFKQAAVIYPKLYNGAKYVGENAEHLIRRPNGWRSNVWTRFELPGDIEKKYFKVFFAIKDVSIKGKHVGKSWPYNKGDGHDAPTGNIKIIDYYLRPPNN